MEFQSDEEGRFQQGLCWTSYPFSSPAAVPERVCAWAAHDLAVAGRGPREALAPESPRPAG